MKLILYKLYQKKKKTTCTRDTTQKNFRTQMQCLFPIDTTNITTFDAIITIAVHFTAIASIFVAVTCVEPCFIVVSVKF